MASPFSLPRFGRSVEPRFGRASALRATVFVLNALQPVAEALRTALPGGAKGDAAPDWSDAAPDWSDAEARLARDGRLAVFEGPEPEARALVRTLQALGLTPSCNLRVVPAPALLQESRSRP